MQLTDCERGKRKARSEERRVLAALQKEAVGAVNRWRDRKTKREREREREMRG